jgi:bifunctional DNA-binding transcriptional regulator/antitoxin component of YhaV-PrlF toxin-antitoxin module
MIQVVKMDKSGRFSVPKAMREQLCLKPDQRFTVHVGDRGLTLRPIPSNAGQL